jgi:small subunit ribosomal protein S20
VSKRRPADRKHLRQTIKRTSANRRHKSNLRGALKDFAAAEKTEGREEKLRALTSSLDKAASRGIIHRNKAARLKSRLSKRTQNPAAS